MNPLRQTCFNECFAQICEDYRRPKFLRLPKRVFFLTLGILCLLGLSAQAQTFGPVVTIPIEKLRTNYLNWEEDGSGKSCGVKLYGAWPAYRNYTNRTSYTIYTPGLQSIPTPQSSVLPGENFVFYCYFNGIATGNNDDVCPTEIGEGLPDWYVEVQRRGPLASFTTRAVPPVPGDFEFTSTSTDPELEPIAMEQWTYGDGGQGIGASQIHHYTNPGSFTAGLTVTDSDGLTNRTTRTVVVPAPKLTNTIRIISQNSGNRIAPNEVFDVRVTVSATADGVGNLSNVAFQGAPLEVPTNGFTVVQAPANTNIGALLPGEQRVYEWKLKANTFGDFVLRTARTTGQDAIGRSVVGQPVVELGSITALIIGLEQRPTRIVRGEDNNGDNLVNGDDELMEIVIGITNVAGIEIANVQADNLSAPIAFASRLDGVITALDPVTVTSGNYGTIQPGGANAILRTNVYRATNYVFATAKLTVNGDAQGTPVQAGGETIVAVRQPGVSVTMHAIKESGLSVPSIEAGNGNIDAPLEPVTATAGLAGHPEVTEGLVGDGVTPLLFVLKGDTKALAIANEELKLRVTAEVTSGGQLAGETLQQRLRILKAGAWTTSDTFSMTQTDPTVYAYMTPVLSDEIQLVSGSRRLQARLVLKNADSGATIEEFEFALSKPPIALIHGYNTDGTWGTEFSLILQRSRPIVHQVAYGQSFGPTAGGLTGKIQDVAQSMRANTLFSLASLTPMLLNQIQSDFAPYRTQWAFTRHDVVAHSQGGLLTRMLSSRNKNDFVDAFQNKDNFYRGRFHRAVTIGSPHNGTRIVRYILTLAAAHGSRPDAFLPRVITSASVIGEISQDKFDPWGEQIQNLNQRSASAPWYPDEDAKFHLVRTTVNRGLPPTLLRASIADHAMGLSSENVGQTVVPFGSDGVVDFESMGTVSPGGPVPANVFTLSSEYEVSHAQVEMPVIGDIFGGTDGGQVNAPVVAEHVIAALDQDTSIPASARRFGSFHVPELLPSRMRLAVDLAAQSQVGFFVPQDLSEIQRSESAVKFSQAKGGNDRSFDLFLTPAVNHPFGTNAVTWFVEVFGTNGVSTNGLELVRNAADSSRATLTVEQNLVGDVLAYAMYLSPTGRAVFATPFRVASFEPASLPVRIQVLPQGAFIPAGLTIQPELYVEHQDGSVLRRFAVSNELAVTSVSPTIVEVSDPLNWKCATAGTGVVSVAWRGLVATGEVYVIAQTPKGLPVPNPLVWLRADAGITLSNNNVLSWIDQSTNGFVFSAPSVATRPTWLSNAVAGLPAVEFIGASTPRLMGNLGRTLSNSTIFTLCRFTSTTGSRYAYAFGTLNFSGLMMTLARRDGDGAYHYDGAAERVADNTIPGTNFRVFSQVFGEGGADRHRLAVNAKTVLNTRTTTGRAYSAVATNVSLGKYATASSSFSMVGDIAEWIIYDRTLSVEERFAVEEYLRKRAGLAPFVPDGSLDLTGSENANFGTNVPPTAVWSLDSANRAMVAGYSSSPSISLSELAVSDQAIRTRVTPGTGTGAVGVVFGYLNQGNFHLFDWHRTNIVHPAWGTASTGMRLRTFHIPGGEAPTEFDFWSGNDPARRTVWQTNNVPWVAGRTYDFVLRPGTNQTTIQVNFGTTNLVTWSVPFELIGRFGHYARGLTNSSFGPVVLPGAYPVITAIQPAAEGQWMLRWANGAPPFVIEGSSTLAPDDWNEITPTTPNNSRTFLPSGGASYFRVRGAGATPE